MNKMATVTATNMKSLPDVKLDLSELYNQTRDGSVDIKLASELSNIAGKYLKAAALEHAINLFTDGLSQRQRRIGQDDY